MENQMELIHSMEDELHEREHRNKRDWCYVDERENLPNHVQIILEDLNNDELRFHRKRQVYHRRKQLYHLRYLFLLLDAYFDSFDLSYDRFSVRQRHCGEHSTNVDRNLFSIVFLSHDDFETLIKTTSSHVQTSPAYQFLPNLNNAHIKTCFGC